jgi:hypothetical protein
VWYQATGGIRDGAVVQVARVLQDGPCALGGQRGSLEQLRAVVQRELLHLDVGGERGERGVDLLRWLCDTTRRPLHLAAHLLATMV